MQALILRYLNDNKMHSFEGPRGVRHMEKIVHEVCGYTSDFGGVLNNFFQDNPGAIEAVVEWIGNQRNDWKDNLESLVGPEEEDEVGDLAPPEEEEFLEEYETEPLLTDPSDNWFEP